MTGQHLLVLCRWCQDYREGKLVAKTMTVDIDSNTASELGRLRKTERGYVLFNEEHHRLIEAIRFCSER